MPTLQMPLNFSATETHCIDQLNRPLHDVRISLTDQCNFSCPHCKPTKQSQSLGKKKQLISFDEILRISKILIDLGVKKIRLTGGEPLLYKNLSFLIKQLKALGIEDLALTTNGYLLSDQAIQLKKSGLDRITVSLNSLDEKIYKKMTGGFGSPQNVLSGITSCEQAGFSSLKINVLVKKGMNESEIIPIVRYFRNTKHIVRFIEYMDVGTENNWSEKDVISSINILRKIHETFPVAPLEQNYRGEVARRYAYKNGKGEIGFISSISQPFCQDCNRLRLSSGGELYTCLFAENAFDLKKHLHKNNAELFKVLQNIWNKREDQYSEMRFCANNKNRNKIEMYRIGG
ncbi:MAG: GTP 3',8-cyclase MoaA [Candidatus Aceula lacicola]|nr:GTP 3',8-cyclase MoaA [Candidatus Aceula lacicola]